MKIKRPMTEEEIADCELLRPVYKEIDDTEHRRLIAGLLSGLNMSPPTIQPKLVSLIYRMLYRYRLRIPGNHTPKFWRKVEEKMIPHGNTTEQTMLAKRLWLKRKAEKAAQAQGKTLCEVFAAEEAAKAKPLNLDVLFDEFHKLKEARKKDGIDNGELLR
jgi:hypothetical protein